MFIADEHFPLSPQAAKLQGELNREHAAWAKEDAEREAERARLERAIATGTSTAKDLATARQLSVKKIELLQRKLAFLKRLEVDWRPMRMQERVAHHERLMKELGALNTKLSDSLVAMGFDRDACAGILNWHPQVRTLLTTVAAADQRINDNADLAVNSAEIKRLSQQLEDLMRVELRRAS